MQLENLRIEVEAQLAWVTIDRPAALNALNRATIAELGRAMEACEEDDAIRVVLLRGAGGKAFVAGADIRELAELDKAGGMEVSAAGQRVFRHMEQMGKPVIAVIDGFALGGGCELAMACTLRLAAETAKLGQPEVKLGLVAGFGGTQRLPRLVGRGAALKLLLTGGIIGAQEALRIGLVDEVVSAEALTERARALALEIASNAPVAVARTIDAVDRGLDLALDKALQVEVEAFGACCETADMHEGTRAFLEKRAARWTGR
jgi:enoyl-CoA hydratase